MLWLLSIASDGGPPVAAQETPPENVHAWLIDAGWPEEWIPQAERVIECESHGNPLATNGQYLGLWQLSPLWFRYAGESIGEWSDPRVNSRVALAVIHYDEARGHPMWSQWSCRP